MSGVAASVAGSTLNFLSGSRLDAEARKFYGGAVNLGYVATKALLELIAKGNVSIKTYDYGGFEKVGTFETRLPADNSQIDTVPGVTSFFIKEII